MGKLSNFKMARFLSIDHHRNSYPVIDWIEERLKREDRSDYNGHMAELIEYVVVVFSGESLYYHVDENLKVISVCECSSASAVEYFSHPDKPCPDELDLVEVVNPELHEDLRRVVEKQGLFFNHPHSCLIQPSMRTEECRCGASGVANYYDGNKWFYYCGGSERCCP